MAKSLTGWRIHFPSLTHSSDSHVQHFTFVILTLCGVHMNKHELQSFHSLNVALWTGLMCFLKALIKRCQRNHTGRTKHTANMWCVHSALVKPRSLHTFVACKELEAINKHIQGRGVIVWPIALRYEAPDSICLWYHCGLRCDSKLWPSWYAMKQILLFTNLWSLGLLIFSCLALLTHDEALEATLNRIALHPRLGCN